MRQRRHRFLEYGLVVLLMLNLSTRACLAQKAPSPADYFVGRPAPDFHLKGLDGRDVEVQSAQTLANAPLALAGPDRNWVPQTAEEFIGRGFVWLNLHQNAAARKDAAEALKLRPDSYVALFLDGRAAYEQKDYSTALEDFSKVVQGRPNWPQGYDFRGLSYSYSGHHDLAVPDYQKAIELNPYLAQTYNDLGWAYRELKQFDKAGTNLDKAIEIEPNYVRARENRAILLGLQSEWANELAELTVILHISPNDSWARRASTAAQQEHLPIESDNSAKPIPPRPDAEPLLVSKTEPEYSEEARRAGVSATILCAVLIDVAGVPQNIKVERGAGFGLDEKAIQAIGSWRFRPAMANGAAVPLPAHIEVNFRLFLAGHDRQKTSLQFELPPAATRPQLTHGKIPENPQDGATDSDLKLSLTVNLQGKAENVSLLDTTSVPWADKAIAEMKGWRFRPAELQGQPIEVKGTLEVGTRFGAVRNLPTTAAAAEVANSEAAWQPQTPDEYLARGYMRLHARKYLQAEADADDALKQQPAAMTGWFLRGRAAYDDKEYSAALEAFNKVVEQAPDWPEAWRHRGLANAGMGQYQLAVADYQKALQLDADYGAAYNDLGSAYLKLGQFDSARSNLDKAIELEPNSIVARENRAKLFAEHADLGAEQKELTVILGLSPRNVWAKDALEAVQQKLR